MTTSLLLLRSRGSSSSSSMIQRMLGRCCSHHHHSFEKSLIVGGCSTSNKGYLSTSATTATNNNNTNDNEVVEILRLNMLQDNPGAVKKKRRIGRGIGSSKGKTSGKGHKGQKARAGGSIPIGFEGGQTRFFKLLPKRGFSNKRHKKGDMIPINIGTIQDYIDMGRLQINNDNTNDNNNTNNDNTNIITIKDLVDCGMITKSKNSLKNGIKLLNKGNERLRTPITIHVSRASKDVINTIENIGGSITTIHYNKLSLRALIQPNEKFTLKGKLIPKNARPIPKYHPYYTNWDTNRGYLSIQAQMRDFLLLKRPDLISTFITQLKEEKEDSSSFQSFISVVDNKKKQDNSNKKDEKEELKEEKKEKNI